MKSIGTGWTQDSSKELDDENMCLQSQKGTAKMKLYPQFSSQWSTQVLPLHYPLKTNSQDSRFISLLWSSVYPLTKRKQGILLRSSTYTTHKQQMSITVVQLESESLPCPTLHIFWADCQFGLNMSKITLSWCFAVAVTSHFLKFWKHQSGSLGMWMNLGGKKDSMLLYFSLNLWLLETYGAIY